MQVFKTFALITKRNMSSLLIYFFIFMGLIILFTNMGKKDQEKSFKQTSVSMAVFDDDKTELSKGLTGYLDSIHKLKDISRNQEKIQDELFYRNVEYILTIPEGYENSFLEGKPVKLTAQKITGSFSGEYIDSQIDHYMKNVSVYVKTGMSMETALKEAQDDLKIKASVSMNGNTSKSSMKSGIYYYFLYMEYIFTACLISGLGVILIAFNRKEVRMRNLCSALPLRYRNLQIVMGCIGFAAVIWFLYMIAGVIMYGSGMFTAKALYYILNSIATMIVSMSVAFLCSQLVSGDSGLSFLSNIFALGFAFLGGVFVPQNIMSPGVLKFSRFLPSYWYVKVHNTIEQTVTLTGDRLNPILYGMLIQLLFAAAIFAAALAITKKKSLSA